MAIILITLDALSANYMDIYNSPHFSDFFEERARTPHLKNFLKDGVKFNSCYTNSSMTVVSTREMNEGRYVNYPMSEKNRGFLPLSPSILPTLLNQNGYDTAAFLGDGLWIFEAFQDKFKTFQITPGVDLILEKSKEWLLNSKSSNKYLWMHISDTHMCLANKHLDKSFGEYKDWDSFKNFDKTKYLNRFPEEDRNLFLAYAKSISYCDFVLNNFFDFLKKNNMYDSSTIIISSDHGSAYADVSGHYGYHDTPHDNIFHIPLLVKFENSKYSGQETDNFTQTIDIPKTILDIAGIPTPSNYEGHSFKNLEEKKHFVVMECGSSGFIYGLRTRDWLYIHLDEGYYDIKSTKELLFNGSFYGLKPSLYSSSNLEKNVYDDFPEKVEILKKILKEHLKRGNKNE